MSERLICLTAILVLLFNQLLPSVCVCPKDCQCNKYLQRSTKTSPYSYVVSCEQLGLQSFPNDIHPNVTHLYFNGNNIQAITTKMLKKFKMLKILSLSSNEISAVEEGAFSQLKNLEKLDLTSNRIPEIKVNHFGNMSRLREIMLTDNPITSIAVGAFDQFASLESLYLSETFLVALPVFTVPSSVVHLYLDNANIHRLTPDGFKYYSQLEGLYLKRSKIKRLTSQVFRHAKRLKYLLMEHSELEYIANGAFDGVQLHTLSLQGTSIRSLSVSGLTELIQLNLEDVDNLWELSRSSLPNIQHLRVTYEFLCCPFLDHAYDDTGEIGGGQEGTIQECKNQTVGPSETPSPSPTNSPSSRTSTRARTTRKQDDDDPFFIEFSNDSSNPLTLDPCKVHILPSGTIAVAGTSRKKVVCLPRPDDFNPCEDLLGSDGLRACTWIVTVSATVGNLVKLLVLLFNRRKVSQQKLLMCTLAFSNLCMGLYLIIIVAVDAKSKGYYNQYVKNWQHGNACKIAGFLSIFSTELVVLTLTIITLERYYTILYPLHQHKWMTIRQTKTSLLLSAIVAILLATLPLTGISSYSKVAICLPFDVENTASKIYVTFLLVSNGAAFLIVLFSYSRMYLSIQHSTNTIFPDFNIAKKMALIVIVNFSCWAPIAVFSLIAIYGKPTIDVPTSKFLLVFVYPINAFTNPFLYFLLTKQFKHDMSTLCARCGLCKSCFSADNVRRDTTTSVRTTTARSLMTFMTRCRTRRNSRVSLVSLLRRSSSRNISDESQQNSTPRNSLGRSLIDANSSLFQNRVSFLLPARLDPTTRRSSTSSFIARVGRRKSYDLAAKANNILPDMPTIVCEDIFSSSFEDDNFTEVKNELLANTGENIEENSGTNCTIDVQESSC